MEFCYSGPRGLDTHTAVRGTHGHPSQLAWVQPPFASVSPATEWEEQYCPPRGMAVTARLGLPWGTLTWQPVHHSPGIQMSRSPRVCTCWHGEAMPHTNAQRQRARREAGGRPATCRRGSAVRPAVNTGNRVLVTKVPGGDRTFWKADKVLCPLASSKVGDEDPACPAQADSVGPGGQQAGREVTV